MTDRHVRVIVDRKMGTYHPKHEKLYYPINYGYIEGVFAPDGEEQDAYIIGVDSAIDNFEGEIIAIIRRKNDAEDKLVVAPEGSSFTKEEIKKLTNFQEQFFDTEIEML
ncbi:MAG TPA: inorganic pyrophosphatase [Candidatus Pelethocola excrementipullorum]|nr:inorganic pyrophosphatase [Candidatus Pelethocola excrementipullorum]